MSLELMQKETLKTHIHNTGLEWLADLSPSSTAFTTARSVLRKVPTNTCIIIIDIIIINIIIDQCPVNVEAIMRSGI